MGPEDWTSPVSTEALLIEIRDEIRALRAQRGAPLVYSINETAEVLGVSEWLVRRLIRRGALPAVRVGDKRVLVSHLALERFVNTQAPSAAGG